MEDGGDGVVRVDSVVAELPGEGAGDPVVRVDLDASWEIGA
ncbi:hypothetical protein [Saccharopolyspora karakumensis]|nr:hypothetical protein [Saccharopolyspora karakumensis]